MIEITLGYILDLIIGDPQNPYHPIRFIGNLCSTMEKIFRKILKDKLKIAGLLTWITVVAVVYGITFGILKVVGIYSGTLEIILGAIIIYFTVATKALKVEAVKVLAFIKRNDIIGARKQLSYIVGRDTNNLDEKSIIRAVVETVAENMSDGVIAPILFAGLGGAPLAMAYKAVNTMDSMFGYKNDKYMDFGYFPAKLDDVFNYIPARITGYLIVIASFILGLNYKNSFKIYNRDKYNHSSPNSAHPEAAVSGALEVQLGGANYYFGKLVEKPTIGDAIKDINVESLNNTFKILYTVSFMGFTLALIINGMLRGI